MVTLMLYTVLYVVVVVSACVIVVGVANIYWCYCRRYFVGELEFVVLVALVVLLELLAS
jgi:hypothetical protein